MKFASSKVAARLKAGLFVAIALAAAGAHAEYPERPIKYILSAGAGSGPDSLMRMLLQDVGKRMNATFVVDNRNGGGGLIAMQAIANADPDGYTIGHGNTQTLAINPVLNKVSASEAGRVDLIVQVGYTPNLFIAAPQSPFGTVKELIAYAKANPGKLTYASAGNGTSSHVGMELFKSVTGTKIEHIPYKSAASAVNDVMAGHINVAFDNLAGSLGHVRNGRVKGLGVTSPRRSSLVPDMPTVAEAGVPGFEVIAWSGIIGPKGLPAPVVQKLNAAFNQSLKDPAVIKHMADLGYEVVGGTGQQFGTWVLGERKKWGEVIQASGAKTD